MADLLPNGDFESAVLSPDSGLTPPCRLMLLAVKRYVHPRACSLFPTQAQLRDDTGLSDRTIRHLMKEAMHGGWVIACGEGRYQLAVPEITAASRGKELVAGMSVALINPERQKGVIRAIREAAMSEAAEAIAAYYRDRMGKQATFVFDDKRRKRILARLREQPELNPSELLFAVDGARRDDFLMGRANGANRKYDGIETIFRDREQVERLAELGGMNGAPHSYLSQS